MSDPGLEASYDAAVAERFLRMNEKVTGLPAFLGIRFAEFGPCWAASATRI